MLRRRCQSPSVRLSRCKNGRDPFLGSLHRHLGFRRPHSGDAGTESPPPELRCDAVHCCHGPARRRQSKTSVRSPVFLPNLPRTAGNPVGVRFGRRSPPCCTAPAGCQAQRIVLPRSRPQTPRGLHQIRSAAGSNKNKKPYILVMCGKSSSDNEFAFSLKNKKSLKLGELEAEEEMLLIHVEPQLQSPDVQTFQTKLYMNNLSTCLFGRFLIWSPCLPSTHDLVSQNFRELPLGSVCVADIQIKGRGRSKNVWESPQGCLLFSFTLQMDNGRILPLVQYVVCLAVIEAIKSVCEMKGLPCLDVKIKWPNDLYLGGLKIGGVLCTSSYRSKKFDVCAGVGINLDNEKPTTCLNAELKKLTYGIQSLTREEILSSFFLRFESLFEVFSSQGFEALEDLYYRYWMHRYYS